LVVKRKPSISDKKGKRLAIERQPIMNQTLTDIRASEYAPADKLCKKYGIGQYRTTEYLVAIKEAYENSVLPSDAALKGWLGASTRSVVQEHLRILATLDLVEAIAKTSSSGSVWNLTRKGRECVKDIAAVEKSFRQRK
jgi:hypothetical protein